MKDKIEVLLINSTAPRQRSISDTALENSLVIIRTYLEKNKIPTALIDPQRIKMIELGISPLLKIILRYLTEMQLNLFTQGKKNKAMFLLFFTWPFQNLSLFQRKIFLKRLVHKIALRVAKNKIPFVGIKVWYGESYKWSLYLAKKIHKASPQTIVIAGGPQVNVYGKFVNIKNDFDLIVSGPGEKVLSYMAIIRRQIPEKAKFINHLLEMNQGSSIFDGSSFGLTEGYKFDSILPKYNRQDLKNKIQFHTLTDGYGCPWNKCYFCTHVTLHSKYQARNVDEIIDEIKVMLSCGIANFRFSASDTPLFQGRKIAEQILANNLNIRYSLFFRAIDVGENEISSLKIMIRSGLRAIFIGGETGHDQINKYVMNKGLGKKELYETIQGIRQAADEEGTNCRIGLALIFPTPLIVNLKLEDVFQANLELVKETMPDTVIISPPALTPGTQWFLEPQKFGFCIRKGFLDKMMHYEYALYKPTEFWPSLNASMTGMSFRKVLHETSKLRRAIVSLGIPTDITDEYFLMFEALGYSTRAELLHFKHESLKDILSGTVTYTRQIAKGLKLHNLQLTKNQTF